jgi:hypothetical protein
LSGILAFSIGCRIFLIWLEEEGNALAWCF